MTNKADPTAAAPLVIFDLDGTLIDTAPDLMESLNHAITAEGLAPVKYEDMTQLVGQGAKSMIARAFALRQRPLPKDLHNRLLDDFIAYYARTLPGASKPFPGVLEAMDRLAAAGMGLAVCTNKYESLAVTLLDTLGLSDRFEAITGGDTFEVRKPDAAHITGTIARTGHQTRPAVMIGDSVNDILAAKNAGIPSIAVPFGYSDVPVAELDPDHIIEHFDELTPELVRTLLDRKRG